MSVSTMLIKWNRELSRGELDPRHADGPGDGFELRQQTAADALAADVGGDGHEANLTDAGRFAMKPTHRENPIG